MIGRIRGRRHFARLGRDGTRVRTSSLWCTYLLDPGANPPRVAFAIGRAVGPAVTRNRLRRRLRELLRRAGLPPGWYLVGARPRGGEPTFDELRTEVDQLVKRLIAAPNPRS